MSNEKSCLARLWYLTRPQNDIDLKNNNCKDDNADYRHINKPHEILFFYELRGKLVNEIEKESRMSCFWRAFLPTQHLILNLTRIFNNCYYSGFISVLKRNMEIRLKVWTNNALYQKYLL